MRSAGKRVAIGGTFDPLHEGHKKLLEKAYELSGSDGRIVVGITSDDFARKNRERVVLSFRARAENLRQFMRNRFGVDVEIVELNDRYGTTLEEDFDFIVISPETYEVAVKINELRAKKGKKPIEIVCVPHVKAEDGKLISSTRIKRGEIDKHGRLL